MVLKHSCTFIFIWFKGALVLREEERKGRKGVGKERGEKGRKVETRFYQFLRTPLDGSITHRCLTECTYVGLITCLFIYVI